MSAAAKSEGQEKPDDADEAAKSDAKPAPKKVDISKLWNTDGDDDNPRTFPQIVSTLVEINHFVFCWAKSQNTSNSLTNKGHATKLSASATYVLAFWQPSPPPLQHIDSLT